MPASLQQGLYKYLSTSPRLVAEVGTRIFPDIAPQKTPLPYVTVQRLAVENDYFFLAPTDTHETLIQVDCWHETVAQAQRMAQHVRHAVEGLQNPWDGVEIDGVFIASEVDLSEPAGDGSERMHYRTVLTLDIHHEYDRET